MLIIIINMKLTAPKTLQKFVFKTVEIPNELLPQSDVGRFSRDIFKVASNQKIRLFLQIPQMFWNRKLKIISRCNCFRIAEIPFLCSTVQPGGGSTVQLC